MVLFSSRAAKIHLGAIVAALVATACLPTLPAPTQPTTANNPPPQRSSASTIRIGKADGPEETSEFLEALVVRAQHLPGGKWTLGCALIKAKEQIKTGCHPDFGKA